MMLTNVRFYGKQPYQVAVLHGGPGALGSVAALARELGKDYGVIEPLQTKNSITELIVELDEVLTANCAGPITLLGHSWGAWLALLYAAQYPGKAGKLILVGCGPFEPRYVDQIGRNRLARLTETEQEKFILLLEGLDSGRADNMDELLLRLGALVAKTDNYCPLESETDPIDRLPADGVMYNAVWNEAARLRESGGLFEATAHINCPVVVIHGDSDPHPFDGVSTPLEKRVKDLTIYLLEKCGHTPWKEKHARERFLEIVRQELRKLSQ
ncbi:MAG: alpha/beta hydrolase [Bacillota bacterium]|jgi:pimeloyl-ACP methyl ester carboxylesterase